MPLPQVAIVGRPNVGKSSVFNWLARRRLAIVDDQPGVTRDRLSHMMEHGGRYFDIVDTGGMGVEDTDDLTKHIEEQISFAVEAADVLVFVTDTRTGVLPLDEEVTRRLRYIEKPIILAANKTDDATFDTAADAFYKLGRGKLVKISTLQNRGRDELLDMIVERLPKASGESDEEEPEMKVAIVGRRNVGKSTFVNTLVRAERVIVSKVPGTTRDSIDVRFELDGKVFTAIDTPGMRRRVSVRTDIDFYSAHRAERSIRRADVALHFFDSREQISKVDKSLAKYVADAYKPCIFVVNKWDLQHKKIPTQQWVNYLGDTFPMMRHVPIAFITGQTGKNVKALLNHAQMLFKQSRTRVGTGELNRLVQAAIEHNPPPLFRHRPPKVYYATQIGMQPPTIVLMVNNPDAFAATYRRYLLGAFRDHLEFSEVPIKLYLRKRQQSDTRDEIKVAS